MKRLGLGTVQFGVPYGITNAKGQVTREEAAAILDCARRAGIRVLDTASLYGDSEAVLGAVMGADAAFDVVTKTVKIAEQAGARAVTSALAAGFSASLAALRRDRVYGLLAHDADDLLGPHGAAMWDWLASVKRGGQAIKIGASVYTGAQIDALIERYPLDLVQLPFNAVDQRLVRGGQLARLGARGVEIHARSVFLQGLLLAEPGDVPRRFDPLGARIAELRAAFRARGLTPLEGVLAAVLQQPEIDCLILGVTSTAELAALIAAATKVGDPVQSMPCEQWAVTDERILSPARWPELASRA